MIEGLEIIDLGGQAPVQAEGRITDRPFYFRARHSSWSLSVAATPEGDPIEACFGREPGWFYEAEWSCAQLPPEREDIAWEGEDAAGWYPYDACDHIHCAGFMPNVVARDLLTDAATRLLAGEAGDAWTEPAVVTAIVALEAGLADGSLKIVERPMGWYNMAEFVPTGVAPSETP